jgi:prevent-host-death family protein
MRTVSIRELRDNLAAHLDAVRSGERIVVTRRGSPVAEIVRAPSGPPSKEVANALRAGIASRAGDMDGLRRLLAEAPTGNAVDLVARVLDDRRS